MKKILAALILIINTVPAFSQSGTLYYPPNTGTTWATTDPASLDFCQERIDSLYQFLADRHTKSFILLKDGKIVLEKYFGTFVQDSLWYWASAGKSMTAFLVGQAQEANILKITDKTSKYLGAGWTSAPPDKEDLITIWNQLTMTSGLDDTFIPTPTEPDPNTCKDPECLHYLADAGTRWAYHTGAYRLLHDVLAKASALSINHFTSTLLLDRVGMKGFWLSDVFYSRARDMARFGLLIQGKGVWAGDTLMHDQQYFYNMTHSSQAFNKSYGYLWWLNGQQSFMVPGLQLVIPGKLIPNAPNDLIAALGKNDQKIHVVPSKGWVVIRQGNAADSGNPGSDVPISFDNTMWAYLNLLVCGQVATQTPEDPAISVFPNPSTGVWTLGGGQIPESVQLFGPTGQCLKTWENTSELDANELPAGLYWLKIRVNGAETTVKALKGL